MNILYNYQEMRWKKQTFSQRYSHCMTVLVRQRNHKVPTLLWPLDTHQRRSYNFICHTGILGGVSSPSWSHFKDSHGQRFPDELRQPKTLLWYPSLFSLSSYNQPTTEMRFPFAKISSTTLLFPFLFTNEKATTSGCLTTYYHHVFPSV